MRDIYEDAQNLTLSQIGNFISYPKSVEELRSKSCKELRDICASIIIYSIDTNNLEMSDIRFYLNESNRRIELKNISELIERAERMEETCSQLEESGEDGTDYYDSLFNEARLTYSFLYLDKIGEENCLSFAALSLYEVSFTLDNDEYGNQLTSLLKNIDQ